MIGDGGVKAGFLTAGGEGWGRDDLNRLSVHFRRRARLLLWHGVCGWLSRFLLWLVATAMGPISFFFFQRHFGFTLMNAGVCATGPKKSIVMAMMASHLGLKRRAQKATVGL